MAEKHRPPRRHHYLPQFYLNYFTDETGLLYEFDREEKRLEKKTSKGTGWEPHYYSFQGKDGKRHTEIETELFKKIEDKTKPVIDKINRREPITEQDKEVIATFISFQKTRVPDFQKGMDEGTEKMIKEVNKRRYHSVEATKKILEEMDRSNIPPHIKVTPEEMFEFIQSEEYSVVSPREHSIKTMLRISMDFIGYFMQMNWGFVYAAKGTSFITSDNPFFILPPRNRDPHNFWNHGVGILTPGATKIIPLSSQVCLVMSDPGEKIMEMQLDKKGVREINNAIASHSDQFVIGKSKEHLERIIKDTKIDEWVVKERIKIS